MGAAEDDEEESSVIRMDERTSLTGKKVKIHCAPQSE